MGKQTVATKPINHLEIIEESFILKKLPTAPSINTTIRRSRIGSYHSYRKPHSLKNDARRRLLVLDCRRLPLSGMAAADDTALLENRATATTRKHRFGAELSCYDGPLGGGSADPAPSRTLSWTARCCT